MVGLMPSILRRCPPVGSVHGRLLRTIRRPFTTKVAWPIRALRTASAASPLFGLMPSALRLCPPPELVHGRLQQTIRRPFTTKVASQIRDSCTVLAVLRALKTLMPSILRRCPPAKLVHGPPPRRFRRTSIWGEVALWIRALRTALAAFPLQRIPSILHHCLRVELACGRPQQTIQRPFSGQVAWPIRALRTASVAQPRPLLRRKLSILASL